MLEQVFLSCSFRPEDANVVDVIRSIAEGLGLRCLNVSAAYAVVPPEEARRLIGASSGVIAVATRRDSTPDRMWLMPSAVRDEISIAYGLRVPVLLFREVDVKMEGFANNYGTYLTFDRSQIMESSFVGKVVEAIAAFKTDFVSAPASGQFPAIPSDYHCEEMRSLYSLEQSPKGFTWTITTTKRIRFDAPFNGTLKDVWWCSDAERTAPSNSPPMDWQVFKENSSRPFDLIIEPHIVTADTADISVRVAPNPMPGDFLEFTSIKSSPFLNPIYSDNRQRPSVMIHDREYFATTGYVPNMQMRVLKMQWRFPASYGLGLNDIQPFVGGYSFGIDVVTELEIKRAKLSMESFGGNLVIDMVVDNPLLRHKYGIAWILPASASP